MMHLKSKKHWAKSFMLADEAVTLVATFEIIMSESLTEMTTVRFHL